MNAVKPEIVDRGRGPQLSTSRITVQDVLPYLQQQCTNIEIRAIMPVLTDDDISAVERYVNDHHDEVMEQDRRIRERAAARQPPPEVEQIQRQQRAERLAAARQSIRELSQEPHGDRAPR